MSETENLILCIESHPCLWDTSIEDYHDREKKDIAWLKIFNVLIPNYDQLSVEERKIKSKYKNYNTQSSLLINRLLYCHVISPHGIMKYCAMLSLTCLSALDAL